MDQLNSNEFSGDVNQNKEEVSFPVITKAPGEKTAFMSFIAVIYGAAILLNSLFWYFGIALTNNHDPDNLMLFYGISIDIFILQAIFATSASVVHFKKIRLFLPIIYCIVLISISNYFSNQSFKTQEKEVNLYKSEVQPIFDKIVNEAPGTVIDCGNDCSGSLSIQFTEDVFENVDKKTTLTKYFSEIAEKRKNYYPNSYYSYQHFRIKTPSKNIQLKCDVSSCTTISSY